MRVPTLANTIVDAALVQLCRETIGFSCQVLSLPTDRKLQIIRNETLVVRNTSTLSIWTENRHVPAKTNNKNAMKQKKTTCVAADLVWFAADASAAV